ncbi:MAG TPA: PEP-CTERM sorting domain-containing protein [Verrucomicrobiae bacterium]|nr:PEP-CTERM sorting domain-containing protein [Verrucomicrobiae bacterium]
MSHINRYSVFVFVSVVVLSLALTATPARAATTTFDQISWGDGIGGYQDQFSQWGQASVDFSIADAGSLAPFGSGYAGWVNIVTSVPGGANNNWAVENMPVVFNSAGDLDGDLPFTYDFNLGQTDGIAVGSLSYSLTLTAAPLSLQPSGSLTSAGVAGLTKVEGTTTSPGLEGSPASQFAQNTVGMAASVASALSSLSISNGAIRTSQTNIAVVTEQLNGCAPGAAARSIKYLQQMYPSLNVTQNAQQVYGTLTNYMNSFTGPASTNGGGTAVANFVSGKNLYFATNGLAIAPTVVTTNFGQVISALNSTGDVEIGVSWAGGGGHCVFVTGVTTLYTNGAPYRYVVNIIQDPNQGGNSVTNETDQYVFDTNGNMLNKGGGSLNSFRIELATVPEPSTIVLSALGLGAIGFSLSRRSRQRRWS